MFIIRRIIFFLFLSVALFGYSQNRNDSIPDFTRNIGYGLANLAEIATKNNSYRPQLYFDFANYSSKKFFYKIGLSFNYRRFPQGNVFQHEWIPFNITLGAEKQFQKEKVYFVGGIDFFYSMSMRKSRLGPFQFDDYGIGVSPYLGAGFKLREDLSIYSQYEAGLGYFRSFVGVGSITQQTLQLKFAVLRNISVGMRHFF